MINVRESTTLRTPPETQGLLLVMTNVKIGKKHKTYVKSFLFHRDQQ